MRGNGPLRAAAGAAPMLAVALLLAGCDKAVVEGRRTPTGLPVPRYVSLKFNKVNARSGPSEEHRILWTYTKRGLPVQVVAETKEWRRICDPMGRLAWIHERGTDGRRGVMRVEAEPLPLRKQPRAEAAVAGYLPPQGVAALDDCREGWCRLKAADAEGWAQAGQVWGVAETNVCRRPAS